MALDIAGLRRKLEQRYRELLGRMDGQLTGLVGDSVVDTKDLAFQAWLNSINEAGYQREAEEIEAVRAACERMEKGRYGICEDCGEPIPEARLAAWPAASCCHACQSRQEMAQRDHVRGQGTVRGE